MSTTTDSPVSNVSLPLPTHFSHAEQSFPLKKRRPAFTSSPISTCASPTHLSLPAVPPIKEYFHSRRIIRQPHSIWTPLSSSLIKSPPPGSVYNPSKKQSFFKQCFTNLGLLGRGSFGEVYKVQSNSDRRQYAVKRSSLRFRGHKERERSVREARYHERLCHHPHIVDFVAAWEERDRLYIQTELCSTSLLCHAESQPGCLDEATVWNYLCDLISALQHLHSHGFVHLDLKPDNILITDSGRLKLGDFGLLVEQKLTTTKEKKKEDVQDGDPRYMAPELLRGEYGPAADVFSLGVSILELACNIEIPNGGEGWQQLRQGCLPSKVTNGLSAELLTVLQMMLCPEPSERATVSELLTLPSMRKHRWRRRIHLLAVETMLTLVSLYQSILSFGSRVRSYFHLSFLPQWTKPAPCTPPKNDWDRDLTLAHGAWYSDSDSSEEDVSMHPTENFSPFPAKGVRSRLFMESTSTPLPDLPTDSFQNDASTPIHSNLTEWSSNNLTGTPTSIHSHGSCYRLSFSCGPKWSGQRPRSSSPKSSQQRGRNPLKIEDLITQSNFKPKNLNSLFEKMPQEGQL